MGAQWHSTQCPALLQGKDLRLELPGGAFHPLPWKISLEPLENHCFLCPSIPTLHMGEWMQMRTVRLCFITATGHGNIFRELKIYAIMYQQPWCSKNFHLALQKESEEILPWFGEVELFTGDSWEIRDWALLDSDMALCRENQKPPPLPVAHCSHPKTQSLGPEPALCEW